MVHKVALLSQLVFAGDLAYLEASDLAALGLPSAARDVLLECIEKGLCSPPIALDISAALRKLQTPIKVCLLGVCWLLACVESAHKAHAKRPR